MRVGVQRLDSRFAAYRDAAGLDPALEFHSLRRSCITHLIEDGHDPLFVQQQVGHDHASTTANYTCVSSDFRTRSLRRDPVWTPPAIRSAATAPASPAIAADRSPRAARVSARAAITMAQCHC
ncbi:tyrosine-type recombinase/integrase [Streptomyces mutomycini]|uniref:tyrosine-type recombinase/integrase n=1 Tax=Streptomyces mutomycini TaxID=284036 RepID=UPI00340A1451